ncbi:MAG: twin-arginine translocase subunit TatB [Deltaproteobacteria bacterium]|nr:twin-arginine translocase subunit TatB [Deltaproteobacteria bacterium]
MFNIGPFELIMIFVVALIVIGPKKLPGVARALGRAVGEFKKATDELRADLNVDLTSFQKDHQESTVDVSQSVIEEKSEKEEDQSSEKENDLNG